ncbi:MAG: hypothetical protein VX641_06270 [Planctomycetota bacterium]|nr:hypothetical protein [Planctomycetota bacterium]
MVVLLALSFDLLFATGIASMALVVLCLRILERLLSILEDGSSASGEESGGGE